ncbi:MAG TPA: ribosomal-processing cysteine protease Prp [Firmicutes bacterium]|jgi:hypothetical protein|nr:ribosomal-processing cysteine protease Prp [Bacillota bacterium]
MITVSVKRDQDKRVASFSVSGHSGFAERGQDIVCAGVSAVVQTTILGLQDVLAIDCSGSQRDGQIVCSLPILEPGLRLKADILVETMLLGLTAIASSYAEYIQVLDLKEV